MVVWGTHSSWFADVSTQEPFSGALPLEEVSPNNFGIDIGLGEEEGDSRNVELKVSYKYIGAISAKEVDLTKDSSTRPPSRRC